LAQDLQLTFIKGKSFALSSVYFWS